MEHFDFLFAAYTIIFMAIVGYVMFIRRRQMQLENDIRAMEERLRSLKAAPPSSGPGSASQN